MDKKSLNRSTQPQSRASAIDCKKSSGKRATISKVMSYSVSEWLSLCYNLPSTYSYYLTVGMMSTNRLFKWQLSSLSYFPKFALGISVLSICKTTTFSVSLQNWRTNRGHGIITKSAMVQAVPPEMRLTVKTCLLKEVEALLTGNQDLEVGLTILWVERRTPGMFPFTSLIVIIVHTVCMCFFSNQLTNTQSGIDTNLLEYASVWH